MNLIPKKFQQVQQITGNSNAEAPKISSIKKKLVSENLKINSDVTNTAQFINQENLKSSSSMDHQKRHNLNNTSLDSSEKKGVFKFTFKPLINTEKSLATRSHESFEQEERQIESSHSIPILQNSQVHSKATFFKSDVTSENRSSKLFDARPANVATNSSSPHHNQPQLPNMTQHYAPSYPFYPTQCEPIYPYYVPPATKYPGTSQRMLTPRSGVSGYYPSPTNWPETQFYSPRYSCQYSYASYPQQYSPSPPWNHPYIPQNQTRPKIELNSSTTILQENKENIDPSRHVKMSSDLPESTRNNTESLATSTSTTVSSCKTPSGLTNSHCIIVKQKNEASSLTNENTLRKLTENTVEEKACNSSETSPIVRPKKNLEESFNQNLNCALSSTPCQPITKVFKPVGEYFFLCFYPLEFFFTA